MKLIYFSIISLFLSQPLTDQIDFDVLFSKKDEVWVSKVKEKGVFSAVGSLGLIHLWNFEEFSDVISDYFDLKDVLLKILRLG